MAKSFLCLVGDRRRPVSFNSKDDNDYSSAVNAVRRVFNDVIPETSHLFLQVKNEFWGGEFTDINALEEIPNRSLVRAVVEKPSPLPKGKSKSGEVCARLKTPIGNEAKELGALFHRGATSSGASSSAKRGPTFNPDEQLTGLPDTKKKRGSTSKGRVRNLLKEQGRIVAVKITRLMSPATVKLCIGRAFRTIKGEWNYLEAGQENRLSIMKNQCLDGNQVCSRRGCLYILDQDDHKVDDEDMSVCSKPASGEGTERRNPGIEEGTERMNPGIEEGTERMNPGIEEGTERMDPGIETLEETLSAENQDSFTIERRESVITLSSSSEDLSFTDAMSQNEEFNLYESRRIREEQDVAFAESLKIDREKSLRVEIRNRLKEKWQGDSLVVPGGIKFWLRLPDSTKVYCSLPGDRSTKVLYEIAFAYGTMTKGFSIFTMIPRSCVTLDSTIQEICPSSVLVVENDGNAEDPLEYLGEGSESEDSAPAKVRKCDLIKEVDNLREAFMMDELDTHHGFPRSIMRDTVYDDVIKLYKTDIIQILRDYPFRIKFKDERAVDTGGVCRDLFSGFWEAAFIKNFDGEALLVPSMHPGTPPSTFPVLGTILSHGFMVCGYLPVKISFPVLATLFCGIDVNIPDAIVMESFIDYISDYDRSIIRKAFTVEETLFPASIQSSLINVLSVYGCNEMPTPVNIRRLILEVARYVLINRPLGIVFTLHSGIPTMYHKFFSQFSLEKWFQLYKALTVTAESLLEAVREPEDMNKAQARVYRFFMTFISDSKADTLRWLLRFITGSAVLLGKPISVSFNSLAGIARRPIAHTCICGLEISTSYCSYPDFQCEFTKVLAHDMSWCMDAI